MAPRGQQARDKEGELQCQHILAKLTKGRKPAVALFQAASLIWSRFLRAYASRDTGDFCKHTAFYLPLCEVSSP